MLRISIIICTLILLIVSIGNADVPQLINYQGWLTDGDGNPLDATVSIQFKIYDTETNGNILWSETQSVTVVDGIFSVLLGSVTQIPYSVFNGDDRYLALQVGNDSEMVPRKRLVSVGYSFRASDSDKLDGKDDSTFVQSVDGVSPDGIGNVDLVAGNNVTITPDGSNNQITISAAAGAGDNLGDHIATENIKLNGYWLSGDGGDEGVFIKDNGYIGIGKSDPAVELDVNGGISANKVIKGYGAPYGVHGEHDNSGNYGYLGGSGSSVFGRHGNGNYGYLGASSGAGGNHNNGNYGYLGTSNYGAYGAHSNGNYGYLGSGSFGVYGESASGPAGRFIGGGKWLVNAAVFAEATDETAEAPAGIAIYGLNHSGDATIVAWNTSTGDLYRGVNKNSEIVFAVRNDGTTVTKILEITGGGDLAEPFDITSPGAITPGMVVAIDPECPGQLRIADKAYDRTVAGCVSGANGINPGLTMQQDGSVADGALPVALSGRVYCRADASYGSIQPGDLLTTSDTPGHAMKVTDYTRAQGAILGKSMTSLQEGTGLVLVLVTLQ